MINILMPVLLIVLFGLTLFTWKYYSDNDLGIAIGILLIILLIVAIVVYPTLYFTDKYAIASEKANIYCMEKGYDTYDTFNQKAFSDVPLGIKCNYIANRKEIIGANTIIASVVE